MAREGEGKSERTRERARRMKRKDRSSSGRRSGGVACERRVGLRCRGHLCGMARCVIRSSVFARVAGAALTQDEQGMNPPTHPGLLSRGSTHPG